MEELRARRLKLEASKAQLAEGEEILVKCNGLCDRNGPVLSELYDASGAAGRARLVGLGLGRGSNALRALRRVGHAEQPKP